MSFASLAQPQIEPLIERFAEARKLTLLVGAGASMEALLPSWRELVERLLHRVAVEMDGLADEDDQASWVAATLAREDLLGAAAVVEACASQSLDTLVPACLYGEGGAQAYAAGPIAHQVAGLRQIWGERADVLTTNYDDLLEQALMETGVAASKIRAYTQNRDPDKRAAGTFAVTHLHGIAGRDEPAKKIVLTEEHYHRMQRGRSWQEELVTERLGSSACLFVGMSLADPNLIRYLYGYRPFDPPRHAAVFVRQGEADCTDGVRGALEHAVARRWARCGVEPVFVDHFSDAAQLLYEIGYRRRAADEYRPIGARAAEVISAVEAGLGISEPKEFGRIQIALSDALRQALDRMLALTLKAAGLSAGDEIFGLTLWMLDQRGCGLFSWGHSDRAHQDPSTVVAAPVSAASKWVSVRTICQGERVEMDVDNYASRWRFIRGLPLVVEGPSRLPIGCLTIASSKAGEESVLKRMPPPLRATLHALTSTAQGLVDALRKAGE